jgi:sugar porter (SP) family MFS transporter
LSINRYIVRSTFVGALGGLLFGFDTAVIAGVTLALTAQYSLSTRMLELTVGIALIGTILGAIGSGPLGQRLGSRESLRIMAVLYVVSALGCAFAWNWPALLGFRFIGGLGIGGSSVLGPVYIAELAPARLRGRLVGTFQINIVVGILLAYLSNYLISLLNMGAIEWRCQLGVAALPAAAFLALLFSIPRSSRWLVTQNRLAEAREVLVMMGSPDFAAELGEITNSIHLERTTRHEPLFRRVYLKPILLAIALASFNQLSGINGILYYANDIFHAAGFSNLSGSLQTVMIGLMNLVATLIGMALIDKLGRKTLLLIGSIGMTVCLLGVAEIFHSGLHQNRLVWLLVGFIFFFATSQGSVIWVYLSEIFPTRVRSKGQSLGSTTHWVMAAIITFNFESIAKVSRSLPFVVFAAAMALQFFVVLAFFPETKGASLEDLQRRLKID